MPIYRAAVGATTRMTVDAWLAAVPMISPADWIVPSGVKEQQVSDAHARGHARTHARTRWLARGAGTAAACLCRCGGPFRFCLFVAAIPL